MSMHLMENGLDAYLDPDFETRLPDKESGPFDLTIEDKKNQKKAVDMNKKAMCQFIQAFLMMSLLSKVNLQKKADKTSRVEEYGNCGWNFMAISIRMIPSQRLN